MLPNLYILDFIEDCWKYYIAPYLRLLNEMKSNSMFILSRDSNG